MTRQSIIALVIACSSLLTGCDLEVRSEGVTRFSHYKPPERVYYVPARTQRIEQSIRIERRVTYSKHRGHRHHRRNKGRVVEKVTTTKTIVNTENRRGHRKGKRRHRGGRRSHRH